MYPWTTPPTSWPTPPQPSTASSTWPPSTPLAHLFGQPSPLQPTWSSSPSLMTPSSTTPPLSFSSLATAPHAIPTSHLIPTTPTPLVPDATVVHTAPPAFTTPTAPMVPTTWHTTPAPSHASTTPPTPLPYSRNHLVPFILNLWPPPLQLPQPNLDILQSRPPRSFDLRRNLTNYAVLLQKLHRLQLLPHRRNQRQHPHHLSHRNWQHWAPLHNTLPNRFVFFMLNNR